MDKSAQSPIIDRTLVIRIIVGLLALLLAVFFLGWFFREPLASGANFFVEKFGIIGVFILMLVVDAWAFPPLAHEPILLFAYVGGIPVLDIAVVAGFGSFLAGLTGYGVGMLLGRLKRIKDLQASFGIDVMIKRHGLWIVAIAAVSPIPFAVATYSAGVLRLPFGWFALACALRIPKVAIYVGMIALGWSII